MQELSQGHVEGYFHGSELEHHLFDEQDSRGIEIDRKRTAALISRYTTASGKASADRGDRAPP